MKRLLRLCAVAFALTGTSAIADDFTSTVSSLWSLPGTWTNTTPGGTGTVPSSSSDNVTLNSIVTLDSSRTIGNFVGLDTRALAGGPSDNLTIDGTATIAGGIDFRFSNSGDVTTNGVFNWGSHRSGSTIKSSFNLSDTTNFTVSGNQMADNVWTNTGTFNRSGGGTATLSFTGSTSPSFVNSGTFNKTDADTFTITQTLGTSFVNSGDINVSGGTLVINNYVHNDGTITVSNGATFDADITVADGGLVGVGNVTGNVTLGGSGNATDIGAGSTTSVGDLNIAGNLSLDGDTTLTLNLGDGVTFDTIDVTGDVNVNGADLHIVLDGGASYTVGQTFEFLTATGGNASAFGSITFENNHPDFDGVVSVTGNNYSFAITAVPEPSSLAVLGLVSMGAVVRRRRRA